ncbi:MAG: hypothetical protein ACLQBQ_07485 [Smithella sp.]
MEEKAKYKISSSVNEGILEIIIEGEVTESTSENVTNEMNAIIKANKAIKAIADVRAVDKRIDPSEMYRYVRNFKFDIFNIRYAIVDLPENIQYKTAAINAGLTTLMWFTDMDAARKWIKSNDRSIRYPIPNSDH